MNTVVNTNINLMLVHIVNATCHPESFIEFWGKFEVVNECVPVK
jgi:hypothetical protein